MEDAKITRRVQALIARAQHLSTPPPEAAAARTKADELTIKYNLKTPARSTVDTPQTATGARWRAWCRCGYGTSPRAAEDRALRALIADHHLDTPECVLCGASYGSADWMTIRDRLQVFQDPATGDEFTVCRDLQGCLARS